MEGNEKNKKIIQWRCCAYKCGSFQTKDSTLTFHSFPLKDKELCAKWVRATKWENFIPTKNHFFCRNHFTPDDFYFTNSTKPKPGAVPSVFIFPDHPHVESTSIGKKRKEPTTRILQIYRKKAKSRNQFSH